MTPVAKTDQDFMRLAIRLAMRGRGSVEPNPMVGCVIVKDGRIIGQGWHERFGGPHAEPNALASCAESPAGATAYVTLEPCCHVNKQTPPCVPRLIEAKLARVVVGCVDPNPAVSGKGIEQLRQSGMKVDVGVCEADAKQLAASFFARVLSARPYVTLKWAQMASGKIAGANGARLQISNAASMRAVHAFRARSDAILVGIRTVLADDPMLIARGVEHARPLTRIVLDPDLRIPLGSRLVQSAREVPLQVWCNVGATVSDRAGELRTRGVQVNALEAHELRHLDLGELLAKLGAQPQAMTHLLVEPGPTLARSFFDRDLADRLWIFRSRDRLEEPTAPDAAKVPLNWLKTAETGLAGDTLAEYLNPASSAYFAAQPSADFRLAAGELE